MKLGFRCSELEAEVGRGLSISSALLRCQTFAGMGHVKTGQDPAVQVDTRTALNLKVKEAGGGRAQSSRAS